LLPYGPNAVLAEFGSLDEVRAHAAAWREASFPGVIDIVPAARTVLVQHDGSFDPARLPRTAELPPSGVGPLVEIPVRYDGEDLGDVAAACGLTIAQVVALHKGAEFTCAFCGFMPGFAYLVGLPAALHLPRRATPRERVAAGSVAIAAEFSAVYPAVSPGGWHVLGTTDVRMWDDARTVPALVPPGTRVRFVER
jgi:KipI family sensor histidine kinase inhibitor